MIQDIQIDVVRQRLYLDDNVTYGRAITYGSGSTMRDMRTTILRHRTGTGIKYPAIVWVGGGGWVTQDFNAHLAELVGFAEGGYVVALIEYRLAGECKFPAQLIDIKAAIRYLRAHAEELNIDADRIGVLGESAGGHLAALIGTTGETREFDQGEHLDQSSAVQAACCWYTPVDFKLMTEQLMEKDGENGVVHKEPIPPSVISILLGGDPLKNPELVARANPLTYAGENTPPFCLMHGTKDPVVPIAQSEMLHNELEAKGVPVSLYRIQGAPHASIHFYQPKTKEIVLKFFDSVLKK